MNVTPTGHVPFGTDAGHRRVVMHHPSQPSPEPIPGAARRVISTPQPQLAPYPFADRVVLLDQRRPAIPPLPLPQASSEAPPLARRVIFVEPPPALHIPAPTPQPARSTGCPHIPFGSGRGRCHL